MTLVASDMTRHRAAAVHHYRRLSRRRWWLVSFLGLALCASFAVDLTSGPSGMPLGRLWQILLQPDQAARFDRVIVWQVRLPYALMALLVGAALAQAGAEMQVVLANPLASPFTLGVSAAAALGAALAIVLNLSLPGLPMQYAISFNAFVMALGAMALLHALVRWRGYGVQSLVLFGMALVFALNALIALLQFVASQDTLQQLVFWTMGSLGRATWSHVAAMTVALTVLLPLALRHGWAMTLLTLGEERATSLGVNVGRLRVRALVRASLLAALAVSFVGTIGFIGLVAPHIARLLVGEDHRWLVVTSALCGALVMSLASIASKTLLPGVIIPVGIVTALVGVPCFMAIIAHTRRPRT